MAWGCLHLGLICLASARSTLGALGHGKTFFSEPFAAGLREADYLLGLGLGKGASFDNVARQGLDCYLQSAGIETGYGFFAPNVADNTKLVFQLYLGDGSSKVVLPEVNSAAAGLRLINLLDRLIQLNEPRLRQLMLRMMVEPLWREYPEAVRIRAILGRVIMPGAPEFRRGKRQSYEPVLAYEFARVSPGSQP